MVKKKPHARSKRPLVSDSHIALNTNSRWTMSVDGYILTVTSANSLVSDVHDPRGTVQSHSPSLFRSLKREEAVPMRQQKKMLPRGVDATLQNAQSLGVAGILALLAIFFVFTPGRISALESDRTIAQFAHTAWGPKDGAPSRS